MRSRNHWRRWDDLMMARRFDSVFLIAEDAEEYTNLRKATAGKAQMAAENTFVEIGFWNAL